MTESQIVNEWISQAEMKGELRNQRRNLLEVLDDRFPGVVPTEVTRLIEQQDSFDLLHDWFRAANRATTFEEFMAVLKK